LRCRIFLYLTKPCRPPLFATAVDKRGNLIYYIGMTEFTDGKLALVIRKRQRINYAAAICFFMALACALGSAAAASLMDEFLTAAAILLAFTLAFLAATIALLIIGYRLSVKTEDIIYPLIAKEFYSCEGLLKSDGKGETEIEVTLTGEVMRLLKRGFRGDAAFDLAGIKKAHGVYSSFGMKVLEFITAYYQKNAVGGTVTVLDRIGERPESITVVKDGALQRPTRGNQFIKRGLIL